MARDKRLIPAKRPRGRPKGSAVYAEQDLRELARYADLLIDAPGAGLAPFLRGAGYANEKDIRRARIRWGAERVRLLQEARKRRDEAPADTLLQMIAHFFEASAMLREAAAPAFGIIGGSLQRAKTRLRMMKELGLGPDLPLDLKNEKTVAAAVRRYEARMFRSMSEKTAEFPPVTLKELPTNLRLYTTAMLLHELSLHWADEPASPDLQDIKYPEDRGEGS